MLASTGRHLDRIALPRGMRPVVVALALAAAVTIGPAPWSFSSIARAGAVGGHSCKCGMDCRGESCCCGPKAAGRPSTAAGPRPDEKLASSSLHDELPIGPCFAAGRCGDPASPSRAVSSPGGKVATLARRAMPAEVDPRRLVGRDEPTPLPLDSTSRLDRPPRPRAAA
ncbi:hypothetical protein [Aquisphaera insulae]|uniref:hypothetical protein n=1 Tax=Aquisphaera insulae TaxID=2712864 RepID=UPI0013EDE222|nr:hypothetical protein [Aquisphaera insulae]